MGGAGHAAGEGEGTGGPRRIGPYTLRARLGQGGMGRVFLGRSPFGRPVAVKAVHEPLARQADFRRRFAHEVTVIRAVSGAFTAPLVGAWPDDYTPWLATVYAPGPRRWPRPGRSLWSRCDRWPPNSPRACTTSAPPGWCTAIWRRPTCCWSPTARE
ncbi:hypothetical protein ACFQ2K_09800 [Streptomyces sanglieri]|uniref:Serine/threonine protein kinase n=1 Tax=Streptomyces sanglieri TaxID=193460 RepID=A0ABW2WSV3_9ACTN